MDMLLHWVVLRLDGGTVEGCTSARGLIVDGTILDCTIVLGGTVVGGIVPYLNHHEYV